MKYIFMITCLLSLNFSNAQSKQFIDCIGKSIGLNLNLSLSAIVHDSCFFSHTLLKLEIDKEFKVSSIIFSDNAEEWFINELNKYREKLNIKQMEKYAKEEGIRNTSIVIPFIIKSVIFPCDKKVAYNLFSDSRYFQFNGRNLQGNILFANPMENSFHKPKH